MNARWIASYFGFQLHDYKRSGDAVLIASGSGLMMTVMDAVPRFSYCIDVDNYRHITNRVPQLVSALDLNCNLALIGIAGWFSVDAPDQLCAGINKIRQTNCVSYSGGYRVFPNECMTLNQFIEQCNA
jgi:hypothetical protein